MIRFSHERSVADSLREYGRGIAGGLMFSLPLLYTMEVWWAGFLLQPERILIYGGATFLLLLLYNRFAGLRRDASWAEVAIDSVEELGIGIVLSAAILWLTGRVGPGMEMSEILGKTGVEAMTVAIGVSVGTAQLGAPDDGDEGVSGDSDDDPDDYLPQAALALCGAVLFAANVAPTDEIAVIAAESGPWKLLLIALVSVLLGGLILNFAHFRGAARHVARDGLIVTARGLATTYAISLAASGALLWFFGKLDGEPVSFGLAMTVVLGLPAVLGASAGRLLLQNGDPQEKETIMTSKPEHPTKNALEWTVFAISTLLVLGVAGSLAWFAIRTKEGPAVLVVETGAPAVENGRVRVPVTVSNTGRSAAANVEITVNGRSGETLREAGFTLDFVPRAAKRRGSVSFYGNEVPEDLRADVAGYEEP